MINGEPLPSNRLVPDTGKYPRRDVQVRPQPGIVSPHGDPPVVTGESETVVCVLAPERAVEELVCISNGLPADEQS